jgi:type III secretion protein L
VTEKKLYTLISGNTVHQAAKGKIVPAAEVFTLLDAQGVLDTVKKDAEAYRKQVIAECEKLKEQAQKEGFEQGYKEWAAHVAKLEEEIANVREEMQKLIIPIALKTAKKIVNTELATSPASIVEIVTSNLKSVSQHKKIVIYVNKQDMAALDQSRSKIKQLFESLESLSIRPREDLERGDVVVETEVGVINARLKEKWRTIEGALDALGQSIRRAFIEKTP